jgi:hypothetical protein
MLRRYEHWRKVGLQLNHRVVETLPKNVLDEGGKKLGILKKKVLVLDSEDEIAVLMDYCIYEVRRRGKNAVERYLEESPPPADSDEKVLLEAMRQARYCLLLVQGLERGVGAHVHDLLREETFFLADVGFSQSAPLGMVLATRVIAPEGIAMTGGAALPVGVLSEAERDRFLARLAPNRGEAFRNLSPEAVSKITTDIIRTCLREGAAERILYTEPGGGAPASALSAAPGPIHPNDRCPCGSGRLFKNCCGSGR